MKNKIIILSLLAGVFLTFVACQEEALPVYSEENNIYFPNQVYDFWDTRAYMITDDGTLYPSPEVKAKSKAAQDTLNYSTTNGTIVVIPVRMMGFIADQKRNFAWRTLNDGQPNVAVEGRDYRVLESYINAKNRDGGILLELFTENMGDDDVYTIEFELLPNENFQTNFKEIKRRVNDDDDLVSTTRITLQYTPTILKPTIWDGHHATALGPWSIKKIEVLSTYLGFKISVFDVMAPDIFVLMSYGLALRIWLEEYEREHGEPYREKNGDPMEVGQAVKNLY